MTETEFNTLDPGLYVIYWKTGTKSLACVGKKNNNNRWIACASWVSTNMLANMWELIHKAILVGRQSDF